MGTHGEEKKDFITIGPITGVNVADLPYSLDQIKEAIFDLENKIRMEDVQQGQPPRNDPAVIFDSSNDIDHLN